MKKRILFVDDEQNLLDGLRRALRGQRKEWDMAFVLSGCEALELARKEHFDAVVCDMRMPGMDGIELLNNLASLQPDLIRIVLSGHSDRSMDMHSAVLTHQYLAKPCDIEILKAVLTRALHLRDALTNERLQSLVTGMSFLPSLPAIYKELTERMQSPNATIREIGDILAKDPAMTAAILKMVNSAFFGIGRHVSSPTEAATLLGMNMLKALALSVGIFSQFNASQFKVEDFSIDTLWRHSQAVAALAKQIAQAEGCEKEFIENCLVAGLLHDIGILVLAENVPDDFIRCNRLMTEEGMDRYSAEHEIFGATHGMVGAYLLGLWGLDDQVVDAVAFHQCPTEAQHPTLSPLAIVYIAGALDKAESDQDLTAPESPLDAHYLQTVGLKADRLEHWRALQIEADEALEQ